jgi:hypothetical protein
MLLDLIQHIASALIVTLITVLIGFLYRLNHELQKLEHIFSGISQRAESHETKIQRLDERIEIHDCFFSDIAGESVDSNRIADGLDDRLVFKCKKEHEC